MKAKGLRTMGVHELQRQQYAEINLSAEWTAVLGTPEVGFSMLIWGPSGHGKTTFCLRLCKELASQPKGRVLYNSVEQGFGKSLQDATRAAGLGVVAPGRFIIADRVVDMDELIDTIIRTKVTYIVLDSLQYMNLTQGQFKALISRFPKKSFIIVSWEGAGQNPKGEHGKGIRYMVDIKARAFKGLVTCQSRFAATVPYRVMEWGSTPEAGASASATKPGNDAQLELTLGAGATDGEAAAE